MKISTKLRSFLLWGVFVSSLFSFKGIDKPGEKNKNSDFACTSAPTVTTPTATSIGTTTATMGGNVTAIGSGVGCAMTNRGVNWSTTAGQPTALTGTSVPEGGTTATAFTTPVTGLPQGSKIYYVAYGTNGFGSGVSSETFFYTLSTAPLAQPTGSFTATAVSATQINLSFAMPANDVSVAAAGYAVFRIAGSTLTSLQAANAVNGTAPANDTNVKFIGTTSASATTFNDATVSAATQYTYALIPFGFDGANNATYNFLTTGTYLNATAYSLSTAPLAQPTVSISSGPSDVQIDLTFNHPANHVSIGAAGYAIYRIVGSSISGISFSNGAAPPASNAGATWLANTTAGATTYSDNTVSSGTQYSYAVIPFGYDGSHAATYNYLLASYPTTSGFTLSTVPDNYPAPVAATTQSTTTIHLTFAALPSPPPSAGNVKGYYILRRSDGSDPVTSEVQDGSGPTANLANSSLITTITTAGTSFYDDNGLTPGVQYNYAVVPFNWDGSNNQTINYRTGGVGWTTNTDNATTYNATSTITLNGGTTSSIDYLNNQTVGGTLVNNGGGTNCVSLGKFRITDSGGDGVGTTLSSVTISIANNTMVSEIAIFDSGHNNRGQVTNPGTTVTFNGVGIPNISANNNNNDDFEIWATFQATVTDQVPITIGITAASVSAAGSGLASFAVNTGGSTNKINVTANQLAFYASVASTTPLSSLPNAAPNANFGPLTVKAVDGLGNVSTIRVSQVTLSIVSPGTGALVPATPQQNLVAGITTFASVACTAAGAKTIKATYQFPLSLVSATVPITISSPGVLVTAGTVTQMCYNGDYQTISAITMVERDPGDFTSGGTFSLILPSNFVFDQTVTTAPTISGNEINTMSALSYPANNTVQFSYNISGTTNVTLDQIVVNGLKVKYTGSTNVASANLLRFGGSAVQVGNASSDARNFCTLSSLNSSTVVDFGVQTIPGQGTVNPTDTRFLASINSVQLVGSPSGGVFSGPGVSPNATYGYVFSPSSVGVSTGNQITYTYQETSGQHCHVSTTKGFDVYASVIQNLQTSYCTNAIPSTGLTVQQADVDSYFGGSSAYSYYDLVYLYSYTQTVSYRSVLFLGLYPSTDKDYTYTTVYNYLGTNTPAYTTSYTYSYNDYLYGPGNYYYYDGFTFNPPVINSTKGSGSTFDPSQSIYAHYYPFAAYVYYRAQNNSTLALSIGAQQSVSLVAPPTVTLNMPKRIFCDYDALVTLVSTSAPVSSMANPAPVNAVTDKFTASLGIGSALNNPSGNNWTFDPTAIGSKSTNVTITYQFKDQNTLCSDTAQKIVRVNPKPTTVPLTNIKVNGTQTTNLYSCQNTPLSPTTGKFDATSVVGTTYKWYSDAGLTTPAGVAGNSFVPPVDVSTIGATNYYVTQSILGCESDGVPITANITTPVSIVPATPLAICSAAKFDVSTIGPIGGLISGGTTSGTWSGAGSFENSSHNPSGGASGTTNYYAPTATEITNGSALITLTSNVPAAPNACPAVPQSYTIPISAAMSINSINPITVCPGQSSTPIIISTTINGAGVTSATWTSTLAQGVFQEVVGGVPTGPQNRPLTISATAGNPIQVVYIPTNNEITSAANIVLSDINVASNSTGTCGSDNKTMALTLNAAPKVAVGADQTICADQPVNLSGTFSGSATSATWSTTGTGNLASSTNTISPVTATYTLDPVTELQNPSVQALTFTLTTDDPDGPSGPCVAAVSIQPLTSLPLTVVVNPIPQSPVINLPTYPNGQPAYCANDPLVNNLSATGAAGNTINWYSNASASGLPLVSGTLNTGAFVNNANAGVTSFYATQKTPAGCESKNQLAAGAAKPAQFDLIINPNPSLNFKVFGTSSTLTGLCVGDQTVFDASTSTIVQSPSAGSIVNYVWDFLDGSPVASATIPTVTHQFALGSYNVQLTGTSDKGCKSVISASAIPSLNPTSNNWLPANSPVIIGPYPVADFSLVGQCLGSATQFTALNFSNPLATITSSGYAWDFGDGQTSTLQNPTNLFGSVNTYNTKLTLTSNRGCVNSITKPVYILPSVSFTQANNYSYFESFENNNNAPFNGGWATESFIVNSSGSSTPSWNLQAPGGTMVIKGASDGSKAWVAGLIPSNNNTYYVNEKSALNSPCFDMSSSGLTKPIINFDYVSDTWLKNDGSYMEYSYDNGQTWSVLGTKDKGLNWYEDNFILGLQTTILPIGNPIGQALNQQGWDGDSKTWVTAAYSLSESIPAAGAKILRLRFVFGSNKTADPSNKKYEGFGIDKVVIQNSNRTVLAESFTNDSGTMGTNPVITGQMNQNSFMNFQGSVSQQALVKIEYHTNFGGADAANALNPADPQARAAFYGIVAPFKGFIDGSDGMSSSNYNFAGRISSGSLVNPSNSDNYFATRALVPSPLLIDLTTSSNANTVTINASINALSALAPRIASNNRYLVQMAIIENVNGKSVLRKLLPDASGTPLTALTASSNQAITYLWESSAPINPANLSAICFVQDQTNKDVLQAAIVSLPTTSVVTAIEPISADNIRVYPNPSDQEFTIELPSPAQQSMKLTMANQLGQFTEVGVISEGEQSKKISTQGLAEGVYILQLGSNGNALRTKVVVLHK